jgi:hypothetical protein
MLNSMCVPLQDNKLRDVVTAQQRAVKACRRLVTCPLRGGKDFEHAQADEICVMSKKHVRTSCHLMWNLALVATAVYTCTALAACYS